MLIVPMLALLTLSLLVPAWAGQVSGGFHGVFGPRDNTSPQFHRVPGTRTPPGVNSIRRWNEIAINSSGLDHTSVAPGESRVFGEQFGPARASWGMAIVHVAMFHAVNSIVGGYKSYTGIPRAPNRSSIDAAVVQAARDTLAALFPSQTPSFDAEVAEDLGQIRDGHVKSNGINSGRRAAASILALRSNDGSQFADPHVGVDFFTSDEPGKWRMDPITQITLALGAYWGEVRPFVMQSSNQFRVPSPPTLDSPEYTVAYNDVKAIGGDGVVTPTIRTKEQTQIGIYWAYDGTPSLLCTATAVQPDRGAYR